MTICNVRSSWLICLTRGSYWSILYYNIKDNHLIHEDEDENENDDETVFKISYTSNSWIVYIYCIFFSATVEEVSPVSASTSSAAAADEMNVDGDESSVLTAG